MEEEYTTRSSKGHQVSVSSLAVFKPNLLIKPRRSVKSNFHRVKSSLRVAVLSPPRETFHLGGRVRLHVGKLKSYYQRWWQSMLSVISSHRCLLSLAPNM